MASILVAHIYLTIPRISIHNIVCDQVCDNQLCEFIKVAIFLDFILLTVYTNTTKCLALLQNLMVIHMKLQNFDTPFRTKDINQNVTCTHIVDYRRPSNIYTHCITTNNLCSLVPSKAGNISMYFSIALYSEVVCNDEGRGVLMSY